MAKSKFEHTISGFSGLESFKDRFKVPENPEKRDGDVRVGETKNNSEPESEKKEERLPAKRKKSEQKKPEREQSFVPFTIRVRKDIDRLGKELVTNRKKAEFYEKKGDKKLASEYRGKTDYFRRELEKAKAARDRTKEKENRPNEQVVKPKEIREKIKDEKNPASDKEEGINLKNITRAMEEGKAMEVKVKRGSGEIEKGWMVTNIINDSDAVVIKEVHGEILKKIIPLDELRELNRDKIEKEEKNAVKAKETGVETKNEESSIPGKKEKMTLENIAAAVKEGKPMEVKVKRGSGEIEKGWMVTNIINDSDAVVIKEVEGKILKKVVPLNELRRLNGDKIEKEEKNKDFQGKGGNAAKKEAPRGKIELNKGEELERQMEAAKRAGDEELVMEIGKDLEDYRKPTDELLEEAQRLEASEKFKVAKKEENERQGEIKELWKKYAGEENKKEEKLEKEVSDKRRALAREYSELKEKIWGIFGSEKIKDEEKARRVAEIEKDYRDSLNAYRRYLWNKDAQEMKSVISDNVKEEKLRKKGEEILLKTVVDEAIKFNDLKAEISLEFNGKSRAEKILRISKRVVDRYRKIPAKYKYMLSAALLASGWGAGHIGGVVGWSLASGVVTGRWFQRIFGAPAAAVAFEARIKSSQEKKEKKKIFKKFKSFFPSLGSEGSSVMNKSNEKWNKELFKSERGKKRKKISRFTLSGGVGAIIFSGAIGHAMKEPVKEFIKNNFSKLFKTGK